MGEMAQKLRAPITLAENMGLVHNIHIAHNHMELSFRDLMAPSDIHKHQAHIEWTNILAGKTLHIKKKS